MRAVIYARYSSHGQTEQSIDGQLHDCYDFALRSGYNIVGEYIDRALTGRYDQRPDFLRMIKDSAKKQFEFVIVWKFDRFARNRYDSALYKYQLKKNGVRVISAKEQVSLNPEGIILEAVLEANAEYYSADLSQKVLRGQRESVEKGLFLGGNIPLGYKVENKKVLIDQEKADIVKLIFESYASGLTKKEIVILLNKKGYRNNHGKEFKPNSFQDLLKNPKYTGSFIYGGKYESSNMFPAIISKELFDKVQDKLKEKAHSPAKEKAIATYLLSGKLYCGSCGTAMIGISGTGKKKVIYNYYACGKMKRERDCRKKIEKKDFIEWYVCEQTQLYILRPEIINYLADKIIETYNDEFGNSQIKLLENNIKKLKKEYDNAIDAIIHAASATVIKSLDQKANDIDLNIKDLELELSKIKIANKVHLTKEQIVKWLYSFASGNLFDESFRTHLIDAFVNVVYLYDDKIVIYYNIQDGQKVSYFEMQEQIKNTIIEHKALNNSVRFSKGMAGHDFSKTNTVMYIFVNGILGIVIFR